MYPKLTSGDKEAWTSNTPPNTLPHARGLDREFHSFSMDECA
jgi:hypothetical protein